MREAQGRAHEEEEPKGVQGGRRRRREDPKLHCMPVGTRQRALVSKRMEGERGPEKRQRRGEATGHAHAREDDERRRGPSKKQFFARQLHAKVVVTAQTGINKSQMAGKCCLVVSPPKGGFNCDGCLVKTIAVKWESPSEVYCSKLG